MKQLNVWLDVELFTKFKATCKKCRVPMREVVINAVKKFIEENEG